MDKFAAMQAYVRVVEAGTFTKAADSLDLPKPTVTRLIQTLEAHLQTKLLNRTTRRVTVTADGAAYYDRALRILGEMDELESSMSRAKANPRGRLRIDVGASVGQTAADPGAARLPRALPRHPDRPGRHRPAGRPDRRERRLRAARRRDHRPVAGGAAHRRVPPDPRRDAGLPEAARHAARIRTTSRTASTASSTTSRTAPGGPSRSPSTKGDERIELTGRHIDLGQRLERQPRRRPGRPGHRAHDHLQAQPHFDSGALVPLLLDWCADTIPIHVVYPPNRHLSTKLRVFVDWVADLQTSEPASQNAGPA